MQGTASSIQNQRPRRGESIEERREISHRHLGLGTEELEHIGVPRENSLLLDTVSPALCTVCPSGDSRKERDELSLSVARAFQD